MKRFIYIILVILIVLITLGARFYPKYKQAMDLAEASKMENIEHTFLHMDSFLPIKELKKSSQPYTFPQGEPYELPETFYHRSEFNTTKFLDSSYTQGLLILQNDSMIFENYWRGEEMDSKHISWSVAKSFISALFGIAMEQGHIKSIDQKVEEYLPELKGSGYEGVKIKDVLQMSTGVKFDENYGDPKSDIQRWFKAFALGNSQDKFAATLVNERAPGTYHHYVSINTHVLGMILVKATGKSLTECLQEEIWGPIGAEFDAYWVADNQDMEMALGGMNAALRDYAKLGQLFMHEGNWQGEQLVPSQWVKDSTTPDAAHLMPDSEASAHPGIGYGYQWWVPDGDEGEFMAIGVFNQYVYVNPTTRTVIAKHSANQNFYDNDNPYRSTMTHLALFREIAHSLVKKEEPVLAE